jgi:hypothetical protein
VKHSVKSNLEWAPPGQIPSFVHSADDWVTLVDALAAAADDPQDKYDLVVAEFRLPGSPEFTEIHAADRTVSIIDLDLERGTSKTLMFDVGSDVLRSLADWLAKKVGCTSSASAMASLAGEEADEEQAQGVEAEGEPEILALTETLEITTSEEAPAFKEPFRPRLIATGNLVPVDAAKQLDDLVRWLELRLSLELSSSPAELFGLDVPGWGVNAQRARALLGENAAERSPSELLGKWREVDSRLHGYVEAAGHHPGDGSLGSICHAFDLDEVERQALWITVAPDLAGNLAQAIGFLNDDLAVRRPTLSLLAQLIEGAGPPWKLGQRLVGDGPIGRFRLTHAVGTDPMTPDSLLPRKAPPDLVALLRGDALDAADGATLFGPVDSNDAFDPHLAPVQWAARRERGRRPVVHFHAPTSEVVWLARQLASVGNRVLVGDLAPAADCDPAMVLDRLFSFARAARVASAMLVVAGIDKLAEPIRDELFGVLIQDLAPQLELLVIQGMRTSPAALRGGIGGVTEIAKLRPTREERIAIWAEAAAARGLNLPDRAARDLAATFAFDRDQAEATLALAIGSGAVEPTDANEGALREAARHVSRASAPPSVTRIETRHGWDDIVLPAAVKTELQSIVVQVRQGATVWEDWGFGDRIPYGQAIIALLAGPSGTGKTMAAQIIAGELGAALFQVDLAKTVSKYIGETEKALDRIFEAAEAASAVLLFDEADALFGKRSEIHDAHDRYANIEVNFLLQRIEEHLAPVLLTTNRKGNIDAAFQRRLNKIVDFPMPDEEQRGLIWKSMIPPEAVVADDVDLGAFRQLPLSGGSIANTVLAAAFMGAEEGGVIRMRHLVAAARGELAKSGMQSAGRSLTHLIDGVRTGARP